MISIRELRLHEAIWSEPTPVRYQHRLCCEQGIVAQLHWLADSFSPAVMSSCDGEWRFTLSGLFIKKIEITAKNNYEPFAVYSPFMFMRGNIRLITESTKYILAKSKKHKGQRAFIDAAYNELCYFIPKHRFLEQSPLLAINKKMRLHPLLPLLAFFGWYLLIYENERSFDRQGGL